MQPSRRQLLKHNLQRGGTLGAGTVLIALGIVRISDNSHPTQGLVEIFIGIALLVACAYFRSRPID